MTKSPPLPRRVAAATAAATKASAGELTTTSTSPDRRRYRPTAAVAVAVATIKYQLVYEMWCHFTNVVGFGHSKLWWWMAANSFSVTSKML